MGGVPLKFDTPSDPRSPLSPTMIGFDVETRGKIQGWNLI